MVLRDRYVYFVRLSIRASEFRIINNDPLHDLIYSNGGEPIRLIIAYDILVHAKLSGEESNHTLLSK